MAGGAADIQAIKAEAMLEAGVEMSEGAVLATAAARGRMSEAFEGLRFIRRPPMLLGAISLDLFAVLFGGAVALLPAIAEDRLGVGAVGLGWLRAAGGIGAAPSRSCSREAGRRAQVGRKLLVAVAVFGVATIVLGATTSFVVAFVALLVLSGADSISVFIRSTLVPLVDARRERGRVLAVEKVFIGASNELGAFESGVAGELSARPAVVLGGAATLAIAGSGGWPSPRSASRPLPGSGGAARRSRCGWQSAARAVRMPPCADSSY